MLLVIVVIVAALLSRSGGGGKEEETPQLAFALTAAHVSQSKSPDQGTKNAEVDAIKTMFTTFYQEAFVDPEKWGDGTFDDLKGMFNEEAQASFTKDIQALTIGQGRVDLARIEPRTSNLAITVYYDGESKPTFAVATATFLARGTLKKTGPRVTIDQKATFYLQKNGDAWTITAYDANQSQTTPTPSPTASPS